jgi:hypothetical protein
MAITLTGDSVTLDESFDLQNTGVPVGDEDNNDSDVAFATLQSTFAARLFDATPSGLGLDDTFSQDNGVAVANVISLSGGTQATGFVDGSGNPLPEFVAGVTNPTTGVLTSFTTLDGENIYLFIDDDAGLGDSVALGVAANGDIVFAAYLDADATGADIWLAQFEPISNPLATDPDDPVDLDGLLNVAATTPLNFNFNALPSGQNLFGIVGPSPTDPAIIVIGRDIVLKPDGTFANASNTINTSQGGGPTTIGVNNQMFNPGEGAFFSYVNDPVANFLSGAPGGLDQNEADDADNIQYTGGAFDSTSAFFVISQVQGNSLATAKITTYEAAGLTGKAFVNDLGDGASPNITQVKVYNAAGTLIEDTSDLAHFNDPNVVVTNLNTVTATVAGLAAGYKVEFFTDAPHNQALIEDVAGTFDIGGFGINAGTTTDVPVGDKVIFEDDGPAADLSGQDPPTLIVDDSDFTTDDSASFAGVFTTDFGTDGPKDSDNDGTPDDDATAYALGVTGGPDADSGLTDTLTGEKVVLNVDPGGDVVGTTETTGQEVLRISVDDTGQVTLDQERAVVHGDPTDPDEADTPAKFLSADLVTLTVTIVDDDGDSDSQTADIGLSFEFKDDGPSIDRSAEAVPTLLVDDTTLGTDASTSFAGLFTAPDFGNDGPLDANHDGVPDAGAVTYALDVKDPLGTDSGLLDAVTDEKVILSKDGADIVGTTETGGDEVFRISVDADGNVTLDQSRAIEHNDPSDPDEASSPATLSAADLVTLTATVTDGDGDTGSATADIGLAFQFKDDGPGVGPISDDQVDFATGTSASNLLGADPGADGGSAKITDWTPQIVYDFATLDSDLSADEKSVIYFQDVGGTPGVFDDGTDVKFFTLALDDSGDPATWNYTFTVFQDPPPAFLEFTFDELPSGSNLFGVVGESPTEPAIIVIGRDPVLKPDGTYTNASDVIHTSQGGTGATIGVNNQMFDPGDGAYFTYVDDPEASFLSGVPGGLSQTEADDADNIQYNGGTIETTSAFFVISQIQGNQLATARITTYDLALEEEGRDFVDNLGTGTSPDIIQVKVYDENGVLIEDTNDLGNFNDPNVVVTGIGDPTVDVAGLDSGYKVEYFTSADHDQSLIEGVKGKFDIGAFGIAEPQPTPDKQVEFTVAIEDFDGDTQQDTFVVGIDGDHDGNVIVV